MLPEWLSGTRLATDSWSFENQIGCLRCKARGQLAPWMRHLVRMLRVCSAWRNPRKSCGDGKVGTASRWRCKSHMLISRAALPVLPPEQCGTCRSPAGKLPQTAPNRPCRRSCVSGKGARAVEDLQPRDKAPGIADMKRMSEPRSDPPAGTLLVLGPRGLLLATRRQTHGQRSTLCHNPVPPCRLSVRH